MFFSAVYSSICECFFSAVLQFYFFKFKKFLLSSESAFCFNLKNLEKIEL